eukprot:11195328-Lingulodinium_polyedra.AAC.1
MHPSRPLRGSTRARSGSRWPCWGPFDRRGSFTADLLALIKKALPAWSEEARGGIMERRGVEAQDPVLDTVSKDLLD